MKKVILILSTITALSFFNGCCEKEVVVKYVKLPCPKLQIIDKNITMPKPVKLEIVK